MCQKQLLFDEPRYKRQILLERVRIPRFQRRDGTLARTARLKALLKVLESHIRSKDECFLKIQTIAVEMGVSEKTASRAIADCESLGLISVIRSFSKHSMSTYRIDWCVVGELILACEETAGLIEVKTKPANPPKSDSTNEAPDIEPPAVKRSRSAKGSAGFGGWPFALKVDHFRSISTVQTLWQHAIGQDWGLPNDRGHQTKFFTLAKWISQSAAAGTLSNPGGRFTKQLRQSIESGIWPGSEADEVAARTAIEKVTSPPDAVRTSNLEVHDFSQRRNAELSRLLERYPEANRERGRS